MSKSLFGRTMIITEPIAMVAKFHHRMPVVLKEAQFAPGWRAGSKC
jgi:putative SOS response-associated peptidase YedK